MTDTKYTQQIDEKTGEIKYVPETPPTQTPPPGQGEKGDGNKSKDGMDEPTYAYDHGVDEWVVDMLKHVDFSKDPKMAELFQRLEDNNKRLRYETRIQSGKLDTRRLTAYRTSERLFKKKAIKHKDYQFTIMLDTSGSMFGDEHGDRTPEEHHIPSKYNIGLKSIARVAQALEEMKIPVAVIGMNLKVELFKSYSEPFDKEQIINRVRHNLSGKISTSSDKEAIEGTEESVAYEETMKYINEHSTAKTNNIVIVLSDGAPNSEGGEVDVKFEGETYKVGSRPSHTSALRSYWEKQKQVTTYGIGLLSNAKQIPRSQKLTHIDKLPELMSNLIQEILL